MFSFIKECFNTVVLWTLIVIYFSLMLVGACVSIVGVPLLVFVKPANRTKLVGDVMFWPVETFDKFYKRGLSMIKKKTRCLLKKKL